MSTRKTTRSTGLHIGRSQSALMLDLESGVCDTRNMLEVSSNMLDDLLDLTKDGGIVQLAGTDYVRILMGRREIELMQFSLNMALTMATELYRDFYAATEAQP